MFDYDDYTETAKQYAIHDIGLTDDEADRAIEEFLPRIDTSDYCDDCGCRLTKDNTEEPGDEICKTCWQKCLKTLDDLNLERKENVIIDKREFTEITAPVFSRR